MPKKPRKNFCFAFITALLMAAVLSPAEAEIAPEAGMLRYPHVSATHVTFVYANDIWLVSREGGLARPLASPPGQEVNPRFSPDGETIAFVGNYDSGRDIYTIPVEGGIPRRVTYHPGEKNLTGWSPDGRKLIYSSNFRSGQSRAAQIYTINAEGGHPEQLPVPYGDAGAIGPDGEWLAYTPHNRDRRTWKRYSGGLASNIWLFNLHDHSSEQITDWQGTDTQPMWAPNDNGKVYYLSDAGDEARLNIWKYDLDEGRRTQITHFVEWDVKWPSMGPGDGGQGEIVLQNGPAIYLLDLEDLSLRTVRVRIPGARPTIRTRRIDVSNSIANWNISPNARRAVVEARGDIWTLPAETGSPRNLTRTSGFAERDPAWSPCAQWIAYFSDESGEYELYLTQSDGRGETRQLTEGGIDINIANPDVRRERDPEGLISNGSFKYNITWSPDSKYIAFTDKTSSIYLTDLESGLTYFVDWDPWGMGGGRSGGSLTVNWSHDSQWITYARSFNDPNRSGSAIWVYNVLEHERHQMTSGYFGETMPVFDRRGDWLFYRVRGSWSPVYSDQDRTFAYTDSEILVAAPLRLDVQSPWLMESDEESWGDDAETDDPEGENDEASDDGVSGRWEGTVYVPDLDTDVAFSLTLQLADDRTISGTLSTDVGSGELSGRYDESEKTLSLTASLPDLAPVRLSMTIDGDLMSGTADMGDRSFDITAERSASDDDGEVDPREVVEIEFEGFERRAMRLPIPNGGFGQLAVNENNDLIFTRRETPASSSSAGIKLFDLSDDEKREQTVVEDAQAFRITPDGKKLLVVRGNRASIHSATPDASGEDVPTDNMAVMIDPRQEWRQVFLDAWRIQRDYFYVDNLHDVDWEGMRVHYETKLADATTREDVSFIIAELISELNVGHAYYWGGDVESVPSLAVGSLGCDFEYDAEADAYRIAKIFEGGAWDRDGFGPLSEPGVDVNEGDYLLEVNGIPVDPAKDVFASFQGLAGKTITITVSESPEWNEDARDVVLRAMESDSALRYRSWVEEKRRYVWDATDGRVGYIHVPNTGVQGQNELIRQYYAQTHKEALIIDERWNGGGQIPTRFIEMLNRPVTNYWARRDNMDWKWPPDAHHGPKCMLINGPAGSGGDMFPWLFSHNGLGKLIGTRTWGGLVGISGNPSLIDGGYTAVPTFGFYTADGRWSIEGHGVDPDLEVVDDPALMVDGGDPQLDAAIELMLEEADANPHVRPARPVPPNRSGFGIGG